MTDNDSQTDAAQEASAAKEIAFAALDVIDNALTRMVGFHAVGDTGSAHAMANIIREGHTMLMHILRPAP